MKTRLLLLPLLLISLLVSCSDKGAGFYLEGESESEAFLSSGDVLVRVTMPSEMLASYEEYSSLSGSEAFASLFGLESATYATADADDYSRREDVLDILLTETGSSSVPQMLATFAGDLRKTSFDNTMNELSEGYDTKGLLAAAGRSSKQYEYSLASMLPQSAPWEEKERFIRLWSRQILRIE